MTENAYLYWRSNPQDKLYIGKHFTLSKPLKIFLSLIEKIGFSSFSQTIYKKRFYRLLPKLNAVHLQKTFHINEGDAEFQVMLDSGLIPLKKAIWEVKNAEKRLEDIHLFYEMRVSPFLLSLLNESEKSELQIPYTEIAYLNDLTSSYKKIKILREDSKNILLFDRITKIFKGSRNWVDIDFSELETLSNWINEDLIPTNLSERSYADILKRRCLLSKSSWIHLYITEETFSKLAFSLSMTKASLVEVSRIFEVLSWAKEKNISDDVLQAILHTTTLQKKLGELTDEGYGKIFQLINWQSEGFFDLRTCWEEREAFILLYREIERAFGLEGLKTFVKCYTSHPFYLLEGHTQMEKNSYLLMNLNLPEATPQGLLLNSDIVRLVRVEAFTALQTELKNEFGFDLSAFLILNLSKKTTTFNQDLQEDTHFLAVNSALVELRHLKEDLLIDENNFPCFLEATKKALGDSRDLPLPKNFYDEVKNSLLGPEYKALLQVAAQQKLRLSDNLEANLALLLPYSRSQTKKLFDFYCHKLIHHYTQKQLAYTYTPELKAFVDDFLKSIVLKRLPIEKELLFNTEKLLLLSIEKIWSGSISATKIFSIFNKLSLSQDSLLTEEIFISFSRLVKEAEAKYDFLEKGTKEEEKFYFRCLIKSLHAFCKIVILTPPDKNHESLDDKFGILEEKFQSGAGFSLTLSLLRKYTPGHIICLLLDYLHKGEMKTLLTESLDDITGRLKGMLARINEDLLKEDYEVVKDDYQSRKLLHFPEALFFPVLIFYIKLIEEGRVDFLQEDKLFPSENPPIARFLLKNIPLLITIFEGIEMIKKAKSLSSFLISTLVPAILQLFTPYFNSKELKAVSQLIGLLTPYLLHKHDFIPLITYLKFLDKTVKKQDGEIRLQEEEKKALIRESSSTLIWLIDQILLYRSGVEPLIEQLKLDFIHV